MKKQREHQHDEPPVETDQDQTGGDTEIKDPILELEDQVAEWREKYLRSLADFQNYQRRALINEKQAKDEGASSVLEKLLTILDNLDRVLSPDVSGMSLEQVVEGVRVTRDEMLRVLGGLGMNKLEVTPGDEFQPGRHEAMLQQPSDEIEPGHIVAQFAPGYALGDRVLRPVKVSVAPSE
ncbi:MAG: nucleotide exchange factor GrpE [Phycisphaerales bacterium]